MLDQESHIVVFKLLKKAEWNKPSLQLLDHIKDNIIKDNISVFNDEGGLALNTHLF